MLCGQNSKILKLVFCDVTLAAYNLKIDSRLSRFAANGRQSDWSDGASSKTVNMTISILLLFHNHSLIWI